MGSAAVYTMLTKLDEPERYFTLTVDELLVAIVGMVLLVCSSHKVVVGLVVFSMLSVLKRLKKGNGPRALFVLAYWYFPHTITQIVFPDLPKSHWRVWIA